MIAPELSTASDEQFNLAISDANSEISALSCRNVDLARRYYAAHCLTIWTALSLTGGAVSSERAGRVAVTYAKGQSKDEWLGMTKYGQMLLNMMTSSIGIMVV